MSAANPVQATERAEIRPARAAGLSGRAFTSGRNRRMSGPSQGEAESLVGLSDPFAGARYCVWRMNLCSR